MYLEALPQSSLWSPSREEDRRFLRILARTLLVGLVVGVATPYIHIPEFGIRAESDSPPRRVRLLPEPPDIAVKPEQTPAENRNTVSSRASTTVENSTASTAVTARERAARAGVLAMSKRLENLLSSQPANTSHADTIDRGNGLAGAQPATAKLTADLNNLSGAIPNGVSDLVVLGAGSITDSEFSKQVSGDMKTGRPDGKTDFQSPGNVRSQEGIQAILERHKTAIYSIYNRELLVDPGLQGTLVLSITIAADGNVVRCGIIESNLVSANLEQQIVVLVRGIDFGTQPGVPEVTTRIPIEFFPR